MDKSIYAVSGKLCFNQVDSLKYVIYKKDGNENINISEFINPYIIIDEGEGRYYYYLSDNMEIDDSKLNNDYIDVIEGGFIVNDLPYDTSYVIEEIKAPNGYYFKQDENVFDIIPSLNYEETLISNYRINYFEIIPGYKFVKTCIED